MTQVIQCDVCGWTSLDPAFLRRMGYTQSVVHGPLHMPDMNVISFVVDVCSVDCGVTWLTKNLKGEGLPAKR